MILAILIAFLVTLAGVIASFIAAMISKRLRGTPLAVAGVMGGALLVKIFLVAGTAYVLHINGGDTVVFLLSFTALFTLALPAEIRLVTQRLERDWRDTPGTPD